MAAPRAYGDAAKDARRQLILDAADRLFGNERVLPSAAQIAEAAGLAKGTIYLYFRSREDMFATLLREKWAIILEALDARVAPIETPADVVAAVIDGLVTLIEAQPGLMPLDAMLAELKTGMSEEARVQFHTVTSERIAKLATSLDRGLSLPAGRGVQLLVRTHAFARGLWQSFDGLEVACDVAAMMPLFSSELRAALVEYWRGALGESAAGHR